MEHAKKGASPKMDLPTRMELPEKTKGAAEKMELSTEKEEAEKRAFHNKELSTKQELHSNWRLLQKMFFSGP